MGERATAYRAIKERKKAPFLIALEKYGTILKAARVTKISRDAVHDWRHHDPAFDLAINLALIKHFKKVNSIVDEVLYLFTEAVHLNAPSDYWERILSAVDNAAAKLKRQHAQFRESYRYEPVASSQTPLAVTTFRDASSKAIEAGWQPSVAI